MKKATVFLLALASAAASRAEGAKAWSEKAQLTYVGANGNTKSSTLGVSNNFRKEWAGPRLALELDAQALGSGSGRVVTAEQYAASEKLQRKVSDRDYLFQKTAWNKDRFAGVANRIDTTLGIGREVVKTAAHSFFAEVGGGYVNEQRVRSPRQDFSSGRAYGKYAWAISPTASFSQDAEYLHNFESPRGWRLKAETALTASVSTHISMKLSHGVKAVNRPPPGFGKADTLTSAALIFNY